MINKKIDSLTTPDELIFFAENSTKAPPAILGGIPKQKIPGWIRWPIRAIFLPFVLIDLACQKWVSYFFRTPYKQEGQCNQRGNCCYFIIIPEPDTWYTRLYYFWHTQINGFYARNKGPLEVDNLKFRILGCRYLQENGRCANYRFRPSICREWPQIEYFGPPKILKGCGFKAVPRKKEFDPYPQEKLADRDKLNILK